VQRGQSSARDDNVHVACVGADAAAAIIEQGGGRRSGGYWNKVSWSGEMMTGWEGGSSCSCCMYLRKRRCLIHEGGNK
jgi:hypothetical protein